MKIKLIRTDGPPQGYCTVGWWGWSKPNNKGTLTIEVAKLPDWRFSLAVILHEGIEALWCWLRGVSTETCDSFDDWMESEYSSGRIPKTFEGGCHKDCPYRVGHWLGMRLEDITIFLTFPFTRWKNAMRLYEIECNKVMGIV